MRNNRRKHPRHPLVCRVDYTDQKGRAWMGLIRDLSMDGVFVEYTPSLAPGDRVVTTFTLPNNGPPFKLRARVARRTPRGAGLKFIGLTAHPAEPYPDSLEMYCAALYKAWLDHD